MYTSAHPSSVIDTVSVVEGTFKVTRGERPDIRLLALYSNKGTGATCGTCPISTGRLSQRTLDAFTAFIEAAEADWGSLILEGGFIAEAEGRAPSLGMAESVTGLQNPKGLGEP